jgi:tRNA A-37 threonylcarbamoyl transferase component Bud32
MIEIAKHRAALETLGLATLDGVKAYTGQPLKRHRGTRDVFRIDIPDATLFLKRNWCPYKKDGLASLLKTGQVHSVAKREWDNSLKLQHAGIRTAELVAYGEECGPLWEKFSFIITGAAPGKPLSDGFVNLDALAREVRKMHDAGLFTPDLFARHIFVDDDRFTLIDMARLDNGPASRDLAALNVTAPIRFVSAKARVRFLKVYGRPELFREIERRVRHLLKNRRKFSDFAQSAR